MQVSQLWRYPVKSMVGGRVDSIVLDELGVVGDRTWAVRDLERGGIRGAKKIGSVMRLAARDVDVGEVEITLPVGSSVRTTDEDVDERVSAALDHRVRLEALRPADDLEHYRRGAPDSDDVVAELRGIFGREDDEPFPDFSVFPPIIAEYESPPGTYYDVFPLMVMSEAALAALGAALPDSNVDIRRSARRSWSTPVTTAPALRPRATPSSTGSANGRRLAPSRSSSVRRARGA